MTLYKNKYRIEPARWQAWDYRWAGAYFITICTHSRKHYFGEIINKRMQLSAVGAIADVLWHEITNHAQNVELGEFVVMPNHIHGILILKGNDDKNSPVETRHALSVQQKIPGECRFRNQGGNSISSIVGSYKSAVTKHVHRLAMDFKWQDRFHDHVIRNEDEFSRITEYISNNPKKWKNDKLNGGVGNVVLEDAAVYGQENWMI